MLRRENNALVREYASETLVIEPWGKDSLRVRSTMRPFLDEQDWALLPAESSEEPKISIGRTAADRSPTVESLPASTREGMSASSIKTGNSCWKSLCA